ncbi:DUF4230 domain-containing protein [Streptacidiphilus melanogenes]|uniref:DUF4230 domain-containing protein n=1 Tax=Streptacidiphilus melanogenes TaxID=411235 RepID=UPI0005A9F7B2|nr:DUF4230 domain-containing protein [Streptacidiphilus melanogenes]
MDVNNRRRVPWYLSIPITFAVIVALFLAAGRFHWLPGLPNPFGEQAVDRSGPAVLQSVQNMSRFDGAAGNFQIVVDLDKEATFLPSALLGSRTLYVAAGSVDSYVDMSRAKVSVTSDRLSATIVLPHAQLAGAALDAKRSYVFAQQRGLFDRIGQFFSGNPGDQQALNVLAVNHIQSAAAASGLTTRAQQNTTLMLQGLLKSLGFTKVTVTYQ